MSKERLVLDRRNTCGAPQVKPLESFITTGKWIADETFIYCLQLNGEYVPCVSGPKSEKAYRYILCGTYKTQEGFDMWLNKTYPKAVKLK